MKRTNSGCHAIHRQFLADGITHMFGNPGTVEQGWLDALADFPEMRYVLTLQESVAVMCADGYARATQRPALVQLHSAPGIGNAVGALYQARRGHSPLVVIGGDAGLRYMNMDGQMAADLVAMMEPVTKYATMVLDRRNLLRTLRRAIKIAATPPMGPVYVCLPADVMDADNDEPVFPSCIPETRTLPEPALVARAAALLGAARRPLIVAGNGVAWSGATAALQRVAESLGAAIWVADGGDLDVDTAHPCLRGAMGHMFGQDSLPVTRKADAVLVVGTYLLPEVFPELGDIFAPGAQVVHFDLDAYEIAKNHRVDLGVVCDPRCGLEALQAALDAGLDASTRTAAAARLEVLAAEKRETGERQAAADRARAARPEATMEAFAAELARRLPEDAIVFDEALTASPALGRAIPRRRPGHYFTTRGGSLGIGFPGAVGAQIAFPERLVVGFSGDGGSMYTIQALYTACKYRTRTIFVVCNNARYHLLDLNIAQYWRDQGVAPHAPPAAFDLSDPPLGFVEIARGLGVPGLRVERAAEIGPALERALAADGPFLIDLVLADR